MNRARISATYDLLGALPLEEELRIAAVDLALMGAPRALAVACWRAADALEREPLPQIATASHVTTAGPPLTRLRWHWLKRARPSVR